jgi:hypothetical protein
MKKLLIHATNKRTAPAPAADLALAARRKGFVMKVSRLPTISRAPTHRSSPLAARVITFTPPRERRKIVGKHGYCSCASRLSDRRGIVVTNH